MAMQDQEDIKKLLIVTGPQGSGNHLWAKIFSMHASVEGWNMMREEWQGHHEEPFNEYWQEPEKLKDLDISEKRNFVTSISCPYFKDKKPQIPQYAKFIRHAKKKFDKVVVCIIGRDRDILKIQQTRVRKEHTTPMALDEFERFDKTVCKGSLEGVDQFVGAENTQYASTELLYLYGGQYLKTLQKNLDFPVGWHYETLLKDYLKKNTNAKYLKEIEKGDFDDEVAEASSRS